MLLYLLKTVQYQACDPNENITGDLVPDYTAKACLQQNEKL